MTRLPLVAFGCACAFAFTGCHEVLRAAFGTDKPVHRVDGGASPSRAEAAAGGRAFTGRAVGELASKLVIRDGFVKSKAGPARFRGTFQSKLTGDPAAGDEALGPLAGGEWHGRFSSVRNRATGKTVLKGLVLATFTDTTAGRACLKIGQRGVRKQNRLNPKKPYRGKVTVLGGEGGARTLYGVASTRVRIARDGSLKLRGSVKTHQGAERGLPRACRKLRKQFGLAPLV